MADQSVEWTVEIEGMTCDHCATSIDKALSRVAGVTAA
ncbi:MAG: cation transporter, partial [Chloroflexi bacterium]|nr:cation transporter [Chloroflexota bacterium]